MHILVGSYTSLGGPGLVLVEMTGDRMHIAATDGQLKEPIWAYQGKNGSILYVAAAQEDGVHACAASYLWQEDALTLLSRQECPGLDHCHLCLNEEETFLYSAHYSDGTVAVFPVENGRILPCIQYLEHRAPLGPHAVRQERTHAHQVLFRPGTKELFLCDLGADQVAVYRAGADGKLTLEEEIACMPGSGPRHLDFDGPDAFYLVGELNGWISRYERNGAWQCVQTLSTLPQGYEGAENTAAAIRQDAGHVYVSNRGHDSIAVFPKATNGSLNRPYFIRTPGAFPRDFVLQGSGFLVAHQQSGTLSYMDENGVPGPQVRIPGAVSVLPLKKQP